MSGLAVVLKVANALKKNLQKVILGKDDKLDIFVAAILAGGNILCNDVPGVGKTVLSKALAKSLGCTYARLQCTADLLPSDVIGVTVYNQKTGDFEFKRGPVFSQILLADEINRATPKAQSALLECMEERQVSVNGIAFDLPLPFMVLATQNPIEHEGTFPLPEAQLDRFMITMSLGYPDAQAEIRMLNQQQLEHPIDSLTQAVTPHELLQAQAEVRQVKVSEPVAGYIVALVNYTRQASSLHLGASPRGSQALYRASQAWAAMHERNFVTPDDVQDLLVPTLQHRLLPIHRHDEVTPTTVLREALQSVAVPA